jgi:hypothetical protein
MKAGTENRTKVIIMAVLALVAVATFGNMMLGWYGSPTRARASGTRTDSAYDQLFGQSQTRARTARRGPVVAQRSPDPTVRFDLLSSAEGTRYEGSGRNIFRPQAEPPVIPTPVDDGRKKDEGNTPSPPPQPTIPLKFFGFASRPGEPKKVFLSQGEDVFIAGEGEIVNRRYRVVRIGANSVEMEDMLNNNKQTLPLVES